LHQVVVITGAGSGLGEATARHLARRGAKLVLAARRADRLKKIVADIETEGGEAITVVTDATNREQVEALVARRGQW
jgi:NADP-dependent 3-hydroxy acid dehydrogenase YdfG